MDPVLLRWAVDTVAPGAEVVEVRGMRDGGSPWRVTYRANGATGSVVVRAGSPGDQELFDIEATALRVLADHGSPVPAPRLLAPVESIVDTPAMLIERLPGSSRIPDTAPGSRLRALGAVVADLQAVTPDGAALPRRTRPIAGVDFAALRRASVRPLLAEAERRIAALPVPGAFTGLVHGDLWQGNALWDGDRLTGLVDWDCAGVGPAGVDLGSLRCDAAICYGVEAAEEILAGYGVAEDIPYWDAVAALSTPPDMDWFVGALHGQGRTDLTRAVLVDRRDAFLEAALAAL
jgi:aminoglycoside phosphotransferase (APT) family kinase protein